MEQTTNEKGANSAPAEHDGQSIRITEDEMNRLWKIAQTIKPKTNETPVKIVQVRGVFDINTSERIVNRFTINVKNLCKNLHEDFLTLFKMRTGAEEATCNEEEQKIAIEKGYTPEEAKNEEFIIHTTTFLFDAITTDETLTAFAKYIDAKILPLFEKVEKYWMTYHVAGGTAIECTIDTEDLNNKVSSAVEKEFAEPSPN